MRQSCCRSACVTHRGVIEILDKVGDAMTISTSLLSILACPQDKGALYYIEDDNILYNPRLKCAYPVREDIPVMLVDESSTVSDAEHERIMTKVSTDKISPTF